MCSLSRGLGDLTHDGWSGIAKKRELLQVKPFLSVCFNFYNLVKIGNF